MKHYNFSQFHHVHCLPQLQVTYIWVLTFHAKFEKYFVHANLKLFAMSSEIIPPSADEDTSGSDFFSSIITNNVTRVLDPEIQKSETSWTDRIYLQLGTFQPSTSNGKLDSHFSSFPIIYYQIKHITNHLSSYFRFWSISSSYCS